MTITRDWAGDLLGWLLFPVLLIVFWIIIMRRMSGGAGGGGGGGNIFSIGKSRAKVFEKEKAQIPPLKMLQDWKEQRKRSKRL